MNISGRKYHSILILIIILACTSLVCACSDSDDDDDDNDAGGDDDDSGDDDDDDDSDPGPFQVGFAKVDVTPDIPVMMAGYGSAFLSDRFCRWSTGVHDPLYAHAVAFDDPQNQPIILIVLDNVGTITNEIVRIQAEIAQALEIQEKSIVVAATHTHHGPDTIGLWGVIVPPETGRQEEVIEQIVQGAVQAGIDAYEARVPARLEYAVGEESRCHFNKVFLDPNRIMDSTLTLIAAYDENDRLIGSLLNWAAHPTLLTADNTLISADYPGSYYKYMDQELGGTHMFVNGAIGASIQVLAVNDGWKKWIAQSADWDDWEDIGVAFMQDALELMDRAEPIEDPSIWLLETSEVNALVENLIFWLASEVDLIPREVPPVGEYGTTYMTTFAIGPVTFGTVPGEYVPDYSFAIREVMGGDAQVIIGLGMDWIGYAITPEQYENIAYLYEAFLCPSRWAGEELMDIYHGIWDPERE